MTTDVPHRMSQHKAILLYSEFEDKHAAAQREREIKGWTRAKKQALIELKGPR
jgi:predicted GIY-YIG superfamily endonuclease